MQTNKFGFLGFFSGSSVRFLAGIVGWAFLCLAVSGDGWIDKVRSNTPAPIGPMTSR